MKSLSLSAEDLLPLVFCTLLWGFSASAQTALNMRTAATMTTAQTVTSEATTILATTKPPPDNAGDFKSVGQNESSISLQWNRVGNILTYALHYGDKHINITAAPAADPVTYYVTSGLSSGTRYNFTLFTVDDGIQSSGVSLIAVTAPPNAEPKSVAQTKTSITLQWKRVDGFRSYTLAYDGREINVTAPEAGEQVTLVVSPLSSGTRYDFTLFTLFENARSSGAPLSEVTVPLNAEQFQSLGQNETSVTLQWNAVTNFLNYVLVYDGNEINVTASKGDVQVIRTVPGLSNGTKYEFRLFTLFENVRSSGENLTALTAPLNPAGFQSVSQTESSVLLQWSRVGGFLAYVLLHDGREIPVNASEGKDPVTHWVSALSSGTENQFRLFTVFENITSSGVNLIAPTAPGNAGGFESVGQNENSVTLQWIPVGDISTYTLESSEGPRNVTVSGAVAQVTIPDLSSGAKHEFTLFTVFKNLKSSGVSRTAFTVPPPVSVVNVTDRSVSGFNLTWPSANADWTYLLHVNGSDVTVAPVWSSPTVSHPVTSLEPGTEYSFRVTTVFSTLNSSAYDGFTVTTIDCSIVDWNITNSSIQGSVPGLFSNATASYNQTHVSPAGGNVTFTGLYPGASYTVTLVYEKTRIFEQCRLSLTVLPPDLSGHCEYSAAGYSILVVWDKPDGVWTQVQVDVTGQTYNVTENGKQSVEIPGFQPAKTYTVSVTALSGSARSQRASSFPCDTDPRGVIAGSMVGVILLLVLICLIAFIVLKRPHVLRKHQRFFSRSKRSTKRYRTISAAEFPSHFRHLSVDDGIGFSHEYEDLDPVGTEQSQKVAVRPENQKRNRFNNVLPYNWSRVKLSASKAQGTVDYINANYMPGFNGNREFIATQGPLPSTVGDFWRMVWEQRVKGIVMVTNCVELGRTKCECYWPAETKTSLYGELLITTRSEQQEEHWTLREFSMKDKNTMEERTIKHFHFTAWPDHGVPQGTKELIHFRGLVRKHMDQEVTGEPTVVHCSAGVGRTGTIIALDVLLQQLEQNRAMSINGLVHKMRLCRPHMVQTESQYYFLHQCIMDILQEEEKTEESIYVNSDMMIYANATVLKEFR